MNVGSYKCCDSKTLEFKQIEDLSSLIKLIGEPNRLRLLCLLRKKGHRVFEILEHFEMSQSLVSHHLADLKETGLVIDRKEGRQVFYSLTSKGLIVTNKLFSIKEEL